jgi:ferric-dicitrate binding protein FerR (iron transport regulator)
VNELSACAWDPLGKTRHPHHVADDIPPAPARPKRRKRVFHTAGLTASAAVLALSIQAGSLNGDEDPPVNQYGDATILDPDATE